MYSIVTAVQQTSLSLIARLHKSLQTQSLYYHILDEYAGELNISDGMISAYEIALHNTKIGQ